MSENIYVGWTWMARHYET